jgi:hypothetical protein
MTTQIKITQLVDIGANLATTTVLPVVNMSGVPTTQKTNLGNVGNAILRGAGTTWAPAALANIAYSVANAAQPNITSTGTLSSLSVSGNTNLGAVANVKITGGTSGYVLQTDGTGNLSWAAQTGGGNTNPAGANTQVQFNDAGSFGGNTGFTFNKTTGILASPFLAGNGNGLSNIQGANISGAVQYASTANSVAAANVSGLGNLALLNKDGNASNVLHGDGTWSADLTTYGNSNVANYLPTYTGNVGANIVSANKISSGDIYSFSGVIVENADLTHGATAALQLPNNANSSSPIQITNSYGNIQLTTGITAGSLKNFIFDNAGNLSTPGNVFVDGQLVADGDIIADGNISVNGGTIFGGTPTEIVTNLAIIGVDNGNVSNNQPVVVTVDDSVFNYPVRGTVVIANVNAPVAVNGTWYFEAWYDNQFALFTDDTYTTYEYGEDWPAYAGGAGDADITINSPTTDVKINSGGYETTFTNDGNLVLPTSSEPNVAAIISPYNSNILLYAGGNNAYVFGENGQITFPTLQVDLHNGGVQSAQTLQFADPNQQAVITGPTPPVGSGYNAQRLIIQGQRGDGAGEGGDVYLWAGDADTNAGDIKIYAGDADNVSVGYGGYINIEGGSGYNEGGYINIIAGQSTSGIGAHATLQAGQGGTGGGYANIQGGYAYNGEGGAVNLVGGGSNDGLSHYGNVNISAGASTWAFDNSGNLVLPQGGSIYSLSSTPSGNPGNTIILQPAGSGVTTNQQLMIYPTAGDGDHVHLTSGNLYQTELFFGNDNFYMKLANTGNIVLNSNGNDNNEGQWTFDTDGAINLTQHGVIRHDGDVNLVGTNFVQLQWVDNGNINIPDPNSSGGPLNWLYVDGDGVHLETNVNNSPEQSYFWDFNNAGNLALPTVALGDGINEQAVLRSQRKIIPAYHYSSVIDGSTPTVVYTASSSNISSLKMTISITHGGLGQEMFDISAMAAGASVMYSVSNRLNGTGQPDTTVSVDYIGGGPVSLAITLTVNSGATTSWVTYDSTEFGYQVD